jgi:hypothetical protein
LLAKRTFVVMMIRKTKSIFFSMHKHVKVSMQLGNNHANYSKHKI